MECYPSLRKDKAQCNYITRLGDDASARENVDLYNSFLDEGIEAFVAVVSSGFMTYPRDIHPRYHELRHQIENGSTTFVLIPSLDRQRCIAETVRRQLTRPFARSAAREQAVIERRLPIYLGLGARKDRDDALVDGYRRRPCRSDQERAKRYSASRAIAGWILSARRAGSQQNSRATPLTTRATTPNVVGSVADA